MVNGGRLSTPSVYNTPLSTPDVDTWTGGPRPGAHMIDAPLATAAGEPIFLSEARKPIDGFVLLQSGGGIDVDAAGCQSIRIGESALLRDPSGEFRKRYDATEGSAYLLRPDGYVAARFRKPTRAAVEAAIARASSQLGAVS
jgi:3-(3-hydroxy-phenyl)propionate hydroxylase